MDTRKHNFHLDIREEIKTVWTFGFRATITSLRLQHPFPVSVHDMGKEYNRSCLFVCLYFLLTVSVPVGVNRFLAVQYNILGRQETFLPTADMSSDDHHPPIISLTSPIVPVDKEATTMCWLSSYGKVVLWLTSEIKPGALTQSGKWKPVEFVWSLGIEFRLLHQLSSFIQDNSCLQKITNKRQQLLPRPAGCNLTAASLQSYI